MAGDLDAQTEGFDYFGSQMAGTITEFDGKARESANSSAIAPSHGLMPEGEDFAAQERGARELLGKYMANTSRGLRGYQGAIGQIGVHYNEVIVQNTATMRALLKTDTSQAEVDPGYARPGYLEPVPGGN